MPLGKRSHQEVIMSKEPILASGGHGVIRLTAHPQPVLMDVGLLPWYPVASWALGQEPCRLPVPSPLVTRETDSMLAIVNQETVTQGTCSLTQGTSRCRILRATSAGAAYPIKGLSRCCRSSLSGETYTQGPHPASEHDAFLERGSRRPGRHPAPGGCQHCGWPVVSPANAQVSARPRTRLRALGRRVKIQTTNNSCGRRPL